MRESIGGSMLFWIVLFFMSIFITFLAAVIQYATVYKIKNSVINYIEKGEGFSDSDKNDGFDAVLDMLGYQKDDRRYIVCRYSDGRNRGGYYSITLYANFSLVGVPIYIPIEGETRMIDTGVLVNSDDVFGDSIVNERSCINQNGKI